MFGWREILDASPAAPPHGFGPAATPDGFGATRALEALTTGDGDDAWVGRPLLVLSQIRGNLTLLDAALRAVRDIDLCGIVATGDHMLGGDAPFATWQRLHDVGAQLVCGPSDVALGTVAPARLLATGIAQEQAETFIRTQQALGEIVCRRLSELPSTVVVSLDDRSGVMVMHGSPLDELAPLVDDETLPAAVACVAEDVFVTGTGPRPFARRLRKLLVANVGALDGSATDQRNPSESAQGDVDAPPGARALLVAACRDGRVRCYSGLVPVAEQGAIHTNGRSTRRMRAR